MPTLLVLATDVDAVYVDWGTPDQRALAGLTPGAAAQARLRSRLDGAEGRGRRCGRCPAGGLG